MTSAAAGQKVGMNEAATRNGWQVGTFGPDLAEVRSARRFVAKECSLAGLCEDASASAVLLTSEVVTNAFIHGRSEARVGVQAGNGTVRVEVADENSRHPQQQSHEQGALDGRGLWILEVTASSWGVRADGMGKIVWFQVTCQQECGLPSR